MSAQDQNCMWLGRHWNVNAVLPLHSKRYPFNSMLGIHCMKNCANGYNLRTCVCIPDVMWHWVWWSNVMVQIRHAYAACDAYVTLNNATGMCIHDDVSAWHHEVNTIKGGSWSLFIMGLLISSWTHLYYSVCLR